jgi:glycosyltransferase involved in cell wall biosynthesis
LTAAEAGRAVRVVTMLDSLEALSGAETLAVEMAIRLDADRFDRTLCVTRWKDSFETEEPARSALARLRGAGVRILGIRRRSRLSIRPWLRLVRFLRSEGVDIVHAHKYGSNVWAVLFGRLSGVPIIVAHEHVWSFQGGYFRRIVDRELIARFSDAFIAISEGTRRAMIQRERIPPEDVIFIPNGIPDLPRGDGAGARASLGIDPGTPIVGTVAFLRPQKALEVLIDAAVLLRRSRPELRVLIVGDGPERPRLERLISERGIGETVWMLGHRSEVPDLLAALDVAVCCSDFEGAPLSVLEFMDAALPIVATRIDGITELIDDGSTGVLVPPRDPDTLSESISTLLDDPDRRLTLGRSAQDERRRRYGIDEWVRRIEDLYGELLSARGLGSPG